MHSLPSWPLATWLLRAGIGILQSLPVAKLGPENSACTSRLLILATISVGPWHELWCHTWLDGLGIISLDGRKCRGLEATIKVLKVSIAPGCRLLRHNKSDWLLGGKSPSWAPRT
jgi:hypothetical protein